jgi:hypothetical protein
MEGADYKDAFAAVYKNRRKAGGTFFRQPKGSIGIEEDDSTGTR